MAVATVKQGSLWRAWAAAFVLLASATPGDGARAAVDEIEATWRDVALQPQGGQRSREGDAQFLIQATFGPTEQSLKELAGSTHEDWVAKQMTLPVEQHRVYYRERVNPRQRTPLPAGLERPVCDVGSRWHRFAVERDDRNQRLEVRGGKLWVNGELRTEIDPKIVGNGLPAPTRCGNERLAAWPTSRTCTSQALSAEDCSSEAFAKEGACVQACFDLGVPVNNADCSGGWASLTYDGFVCDVVDEVGGVLRLSSEPFCAGTQQRVMRNPGVWLARPPQSSATQPRFRGMRPGVLLLAESPANCALPEIAQVQACSGGVPDVCQPGQFVRHSARLELLRNTPEAPVAVPGTAATLCPTVRRHPLNIGSCRVKPACMPGWTAKVEVLLSSENLIRLAALSANRLVYSVSGSSALADERKVYDFTDWAKRDPTTAATILPFVKGSALVLPATFDSNRWKSVSAQVAPALLGKLGDTVDFIELPEGLRLPAIADAFQQKAQPVHYEVCGSPGEVANEPSQGHWYALTAQRLVEANWVDWDYEVPGPQGFWLSRVNVWLQRAMYGRDQLRQRMAWALSQIFVHGEDGLNLVEGKLAFYDIFLRNAFGNFRDVLREVTYSPMMGSYLTYAFNKGFHVQGTFPDENYAREIMQLFTIGLWQLKPDGTRQLAANGQPVPTYSNLHIQNFARVFTGLAYMGPRANIEHHFSRNSIDPMQMVAEWHDPFPKADLGDGYLGDGYPLCADLPANAFLRKGARFEFAGFQPPSGVSSSSIFSVSTASQLHRALCQPSKAQPPAQCAFQTLVELQQPLACAAEQCTWQLPRFLRVSNGGSSEGFYEFAPPPCVRLFFDVQAVSLAVDAEGLVSPQTDALSRKNRFPVAWSEQFPAPSAQSCASAGCAFASSTCICNATVVTSAAFNQLPTEEQVKSLAVGAFPPTANCSLCGKVRAYFAASGRMDAGTVFEVGGRFWRNVLSTVRVGTRRFRNPPNFMVPGTPRPRDAFNEIEAFLDLLVNHPSTPVFTSYRLIQRFGNSNPSARYVSDVVKAFRTGTYEGGSYSGRYGDLGATLAAILLHPEARAIGLAQAGALREPALKLVHVLRSLEYVDRFGRPMFVNDRLGGTGEEPLASPTVFNFYHFDFQPSAFLASDALRALVAPEYEIMDSSKLVTFINGLMSVVANAGLSNCNRGFGLPTAGLSGLLSRISLCQQGDFLALTRLRGSTASSALSQLSLLLTGGRLSQESLAAVTASYQADFPGPYDGALVGSPLPGSPTFRTLSEAQAAALKDDAVVGVAKASNGAFVLRTGSPTSFQSSAGSTSWVKKATPAAKLAAAPAAIMLTPEFNTAGGRGGSVRSGAQATTTTPAPAPVNPQPYRALVQLYLSGGADTFQLIVPRNCELYNQYKAIRGSVALKPDELHPVPTPNQPCEEFGVHKELAFLAELYKGGEAAFVANVGNLAEPLLNRQEFLTGTKTRCVGLFSHADQVKAAQTLLCQNSAAAAQLGAGGRMADILANKYRTASFSLVGNPAWSDALKVQTSTVSPDGVVRIEDLGGLQPIITNITSRVYDGVYSEIYVRGLADTVRQSESLGAVLDSVQLQTKFPTSTLMQRQLYQVARIIASRAKRQAERDLFYVPLGGFDTHKEVNPTLDRLFLEVNDALEAFVAELKAQGTWRSTVLFTASDFGRTLTPNDNSETAGTDHAWAGNHIVMGGAIQGKQIFNDFPSKLQEGADLDVGRGRFIPKYPYESYMVPLSQWMGLEDGQLNGAFPNLAKFNRSVHILSTKVLFKP